MAKCTGAPGYGGAETARTELASEMAAGRVIQFFFYEQWRALRLYCAQKSIRVVGDIAIFVDYDSADVWANRELFRLKDDLSPEFVSGVPPDAFSATGQAGEIPFTTGMRCVPKAISGGCGGALGHADL